MATPEQAWGSQAPTAEQRILTACQRAAFPPLSPYTYFYVVQPGDTLSQIAERFGGIANGVTVEEIARINNIPNPDFIHEGQYLSVPLYIDYGLSQGSSINLFSPGETAVREGAVVRGDLDMYRLHARPGQQIFVSISSLEANAAFQICPWAGPNAGQALPSAGELDDATAWSGVFPAGATPMIVVGATRGNASYRLEVGVV